MSKVSRPVTFNSFVLALFAYKHHGPFCGALEVTQRMCFGFATSFNISSHVADYQGVSTAVHISLCRQQACMAFRLLQTLHGEQVHSGSVKPLHSTMSITHSQISWPTQSAAHKPSRTLHMPWQGYAWWTVRAFRRL
jgi:hypothetical protein